MDPIIAYALIGTIVGGLLTWYIHKNSDTSSKHNKK
jgi:hypothetical protein